MVLFYEKRTKNDGWFAFCEAKLRIPTGFQNYFVILKLDSPHTPNGQGRVLRWLGGVCGGCPCTHPFHGVMGWGCDLNFTPTRKGEVKNCGVIVEVGLAFAPIPTREGEVKAIGENHRCWCYRKTKLLSGEAAISLPLRGRWHFCLQK
jgi:hypothetical protein